MLSLGILNLYNQIITIAMWKPVQTQLFNYTGMEPYERVKKKKTERTRVHTTRGFHLIRVASVLHPLQVNLSISRSRNKFLTEKGQLVSDATQRKEI